MNTRVVHTPADQHRPAQQTTGHRQSQPTSNQQQTKENATATMYHTPVATLHTMQHTSWKLLHTLSPLSLLLRGKSCIQAAYYQLYTVYGFSFICVITSPVLYNTPLAFQHPPTRKEESSSIHLSAAVHMCELGRAVRPPPKCLWSVKRKPYHTQEHAARGTQRAYHLFRSNEIKSMFQELEFRTANSFRKAFCLSRAKRSQHPPGKEILGVSAVLNR